ncbi:prolyl oligopeptidase family serine peptidase [Streptomyces sp. NPDC056672]|uniref:prolyl oligopeptidase family serine peptidase n=1 Tax=Streptomyces sp. NPDC056672 TaxID=3345906 RepID=UPI0036D06D4B
MTVRIPGTRTSDDIETLAQVQFADPYQWLEADTEEVRQWQDQQAEAAAAYVRDWPHFDHVRASVARLFTSRIASVPRAAGGLWFRTHTTEGSSQAQVIVTNEPFGSGRVLFDPRDENPDEPPFLSWISPSPDARTLAVGVCDDGSERNTIRLIDVDSGTLLPSPPSQALMDNWTGGAHWLPDSSGFFFTGVDGTSTEWTQSVWLHRRQTPSTTVVDAPWQSHGSYRTVVVSRDGRHLIAVERLADPVPIAVAPLGDDPGAVEWIPFINEVDGTVVGHLIGDEWIAVTDIGAPRGRVVSVRLDSPTPNDPSSWKELVPESDAVIRTVTPVGDTLYLSEFVDTYARVRITDTTGAPQGYVPLPGRGALAELPFLLMTVLPEAVGDDFLFGFSTLTQSAGVYRHVPGTASLETLREPSITLVDAVIEDGWATSQDGTRIPFHIVRRRDLPLNRPRPALIHAYGGFNAPWVPHFSGPLAAFVEAGGVLVHGHLRGGGELGREWWEGGRLENKQNCYADLYAIAHDLISTGVTSPGLLAVTGSSNGGLLAGVAATQRPHLWAAVIPRVPLLDIIGACHDGYGRMAVGMDFGDPDDPDEVRRMAQFSPYHLVEDGVDYPAVFIDAGDTDPRCPAWHSRKFAARLQTATRGQAPILLRVWRNVGHGWATDREIAITENAEWLAFTMKTLGMTPRAEHS